MRLKKSLIILSLLPGIILILNSKTYACSCAPIPPPCEAFSHSSAVFIGFITRSRATDDKHHRGTLHTIKVEEVFLGDLSGEIEAAGGMCGYEFKEGKRYLIYIGPGDNKGVYFVTYCGRTRRVEDADEDLKFLRTYRLKLNVARIHIDLMWDVQSLYSLPKEKRAQPPGMVRIKMRGQSSYYDLVSEENGLVEVIGLRPGFYTVEIIPPVSAKVIGSSSRVLYTSGQGCSKLIFVISNQR